jgi:hypothetical protein
MVPTYTKTLCTRVQCHGCPCGIRRQACHGLFRAGRNSRRAMQHGATHFLCKNHGCEGSSTLLRLGNCSRIGDRKHWCARWSPPRGGLTRLHACARVRQYATTLLVATSLVHQLWTTSRSLQTLLVMEEQDTSWARMSLHFLARLPHVDDDVMRRPEDTQSTFVLTLGVLFLRCAHVLYTTTWKFS